MAGGDQYVELHAHSAFSFLDGASTPAELAAAAARLGYPAFALTDHDGVWGSMEFVQACEGIGVAGTITGAEVTVGRQEFTTSRSWSKARPVTATCVGCLPKLTHTHAIIRNEPRGSQGDAGAGRGACGGVGLPVGLRLEGRGRWDVGEGRQGASALARQLLAAFGSEHFRVELQRPYWRRDRGRNRWLSWPRRTARGRPAWPPAMSTRTPAAARGCRTPSLRCGWE